MENVRRFTLTHTIKKFHVCSPSESNESRTHYNVPWRCDVLRVGLDKEDRDITLRVFCLKEAGSNLWSIVASANITLKSETAEVKYRMGSVTLNEKYMIVDMDVILDREVLDKFTADKKVTMICEVTIEKMIGISQKRKANFEYEDGMMTDVVLVVEKKKFHVSKVMLASFSPVFRAMFSNGCRETEEKEVVIKDTNAQDFESFLMLIYSCDPTIQKNNVEGLLQLADRYDVDTVRVKCERFLIRTDKMRKKDKLVLAERYMLSSLQKTILDCLDTLEDVKSLNIDEDEMGEATAKALYSKLMRLD